MNTTGKRIMQKILAIFVILTMTMADLTIVGGNIVSYAINLSQTNNNNVEFSAYLGKEEKQLESTATIDENLNLAIKISVKNDGYLSDGKIQLEEGANFKFKKNSTDIHINKIEENAIYLNQINEGENIELNLEIEFANKDELSLDYLNKTSILNLSGKYINSKNVESNKFTNVEGKAEVKINWQSKQDINANLNLSLLTNDIFDIDGLEKRIIQVLIKSKLDNNSYPVKNTKIELNIEKQPENVTVHKRSTAATNGDEEFTANNYLYKDNTLTINIENGKNGKINWKKNSEDTFVVTLTYPKNEEVLDSSINANATIISYDEKETVSDKQITVNQNIDNIVTNMETAESAEIGKGKIYTGEGKTYKTTTEVYIDYAKPVKKLEINEKASVFIAQNEEKKANIEFIQTIINKNEFLKIFGEEGKVIILDQNQEIIDTISKDTETDEQGNININYEEGITDIKLLPTNPVVEGIFKIENIKKINKLEYTREEIKEINQLKDLSKVIYTSNSEETKESTSVIGLKETESKANLKVEQTSITTSRDDQELHITAQLETNTEDGDLYKNPEIKITLPKQVKGVAAQAKLLYANGLSLENDNFKIVKEDENYTINAKLNGEQINYGGENPEGTKLLVNAKVKLDELATNSEEDITLNYTNENATLYADNGTQKVGVNIVSENPMILTNSIDELNVSATGNEEGKVVELENNANSKNATVKMKILNNEGTDIKNIKIIGKIADNGEKILRTSRVNTNIESAKIYYTKSENPTSEINKDINGWSEENIQNAKYFLVAIDNLENGQNIEINYDISLESNLGYNVEANASYKVIYINKLTGQERQVESANIKLSTGTVAELKLDVKAQVAGEQIKDGGEVKAGEIITYTVSLTNSGRENAQNVILNANIPENTTLLEVNKDYGKNTGNTITITEDDMRYLIEKTDKQIVKQLETLESGKTISYTYMVKVDTDINEEKNVKSDISVKYKDGEEITKSATVKIVPGNLDVELRLKPGLDSDELQTGYNYQYSLIIHNNSNNEQKNVQVAINHNSLIELTDVQYIVRDTNDPKYTENRFTIDSIPANGMAAVNIITQINLDKDNLKNAEIFVTAKDSSNKEYRSIMLSNKVTGVEVETELLASNGETGYLHPGEDITYTINVKNTGKIDAELLSIQDNFSDYLDIKAVKLNGTECEYDERTEFMKGAEYNILAVESPLKVNEEAKLEISAKVNEDINTEELIKVVNKASVYSDILLGESVEKVAYIESLPKLQEIASEPEAKTIDDENSTIDPEENNNNVNNNNGNNNSNSNENNNGENGNIQNENNENNENIEKFIISGTVWEDTNQNGSRDSGEKLVEGINVYAIDTKNNKIATDNNKIKISAKTNSDGFYTLANMPKGQYVIAFEYNTEKYITTVYQADGISSDRNSDAVKGTRNIEGEEKVFAYTDTINLTEGKANIDLGLAEAKTFDFELEKVVTKMVVTNKEGTKTYNYNDSKLAKVEIRSKYLNGSNVVIEYKIMVKNNGEIAGYVKNIVDYIPTSLKFSSSLNSDWYQNGNYIYNSSLANTKIEPGETKAVTLVLTKNITENNTGLTNNKAEITSVYNALGITDIDSTPNNNQKNEDDLGSADILINPSTGATISYIVLTLVTIIVICGIAYVVNKKILSRTIKI